MRSLTSSRSISNSAMSFSASNVTSSLISFGVIGLPRSAAPKNTRRGFRSLLFVTLSDQFKQLFAYRGQYVIAALGDQKHVFDADAAFTRKIDPGLDGDHHPGPENCITACGQ